jgi:hypothetical protein
LRSGEGKKKQSRGERAGLYSSSLFWRNWAQKGRALLLGLRAGRALLFLYGTNGLQVARLRMQIQKISVSRLHCEHVSVHCLKF